MYVLCANLFISKDSTWTGGVELKDNISKYKYIGLSFGISDNPCAESCITTIVPVSMFIQSSINYAASVVYDVFNPSNNRSVYVAYESDKTIKVYRGSEVYMYLRLNIYGFK